MTSKEIIAYIKSHSLKIKIDKDGMGDVWLSEIRHQVFIPKQKISVIRTWFSRLWDIKLTDNELKILKTIIVKPKSAQWDLISKIVVNQTQLSSDDLITWFNYVKEGDRASVADKIIIDARIKSKSFKISLFEELLNNRNINHQKSIIRLLNDSLYSGKRDFWVDCFEILIDYINVTDNKLTREFARFIHDNLPYLLTFAEEQKTISLIMYEETKRECFLPQSAKDAFLF